LIRVLQISNKAPYPANDGSSIAVYNMALGLVENKVQLTLLCINTKKHFKPDNAVDSNFKKATNYKSVFVNTDTSVVGAFLNLFSNQSYFVSRFHTKDFELELVQLLTSGEYDIIQLEGVFMAVYLPVIKKYCKAKVVIRTHNVEHKIWDRHIQSEKNLVKRCYLNIQNTRLKKFELSSLNAVDVAVTISPDDLTNFKNLKVACKLFNSITGVNFSNYQLNKSITIQENTLFYFASMDWLPNQEAVDWFLKTCWPILSSKNESIKLVIAGRNMPGRYKQLNSERIMVIENVLNPVDFYSSYQVLIVPLLSGSGVRIKIIEGMSYGKPIISTSVGAEGIGAVEGEHLMIADSPEDFVRTIIEVLNDPVKLNQLSSNALNFAKKNFNNQLIVADLLKYYQKLLNE
jgi:glycosyltransferase involved in cell wall biosynthesis